MKFWWSSDGRRSIHWAAKSLLCKGKEAGGLNFRDIVLMNESFLAKQFWRILTKPDTIVSKVLKAKYFNNCDILQLHLMSNSSPAWNGNWNRGQRITKGIRVDVDRNLIWLGDPSNAFSVKSV